jgi:hypothetical protein
MFSTKQLVNDINVNLNNHRKKTIEELIYSLNIPIVGGKGASSIVLRNIINKITTESDLRFSNDNFSIKIIPVDANTNKCYETLSFRTIKIIQILNLDFVNSSVMSEIQNHVYIPIYKNYRQEIYTNGFLGQAFGLSFDGDLYNSINDDYIIYQNFFKILELTYQHEGFEKMKLYWDKNFPRSRATQIIHMRPHAQNKFDYDASMEGYRITKHSFWLNRPFINNLLQNHFMK